MRKYILPFVLICSSTLLSFISFADQGIVQNEAVDTILKAEFHRVEAIGSLYNASSLCRHILDINDRAKLKTLIWNTRDLLPYSDSEITLLTDGLFLIRLVAWMEYDKFCEIRRHLIDGEYHIRMMHIYKTLAVAFPEPIIDRTCWAYIQAIECLVRCEKLERGMIFDPYFKKTNPSQLASQILKGLTDQLVETLLYGKLENMLSNELLDKKNLLKELFTGLYDWEFAREILGEVDKAYQYLLAVEIQQEV